MYQRSCLDSLKKYVWPSRSLLPVLLVASLLPLEQLQGKRWAVQTIFSPNYMSYTSRSGFNPERKILLHSQFCSPLRCCELSLLVMRVKSKGDIQRPSMWDMLGYTLEDIRLGFGERSHNNKQTIMEQPTKLQHLPSCNPQKSGADVVARPLTLCRCRQMYFPSRGPALIHLCAGSSLSHHHHHHTRLMFTPNSDP